MKTVRSFVCSVGLSVALCAIAGAEGALAQPGDASPQPASPTIATMNATGTKSADRILRKTVLRQLTRTRGLSADGINVIAKNGVITLVGTAPETDQIDLAAEVAKQVPGVVEVRNGLTLQADRK